MTFNIPPSEKEIENVHKAMQELKESLRHSSKLAQDFTEMLEDNFLAIDEWNRKELFLASSGISTALWDLNISLHKMRNYQSRIISQKS